MELVRLAGQPRVKLGILRGRLPKELLDGALEPLSAEQIGSLFANAIEPR